MARPGVRPRSLAWAALIAVVAAAVAFGSGLLSPVSSQPRKIRVSVPPGASVSRIARTLKTKGLIRSATLFKVLARAGGGWDIKAGSYALSPSMPTRKILDVLRTGKVEPTLRVTFPEGFTLQKIAERAQRIPGLRAEDFEREAVTEGTSFDAPFPLPKNLEGYLFPDTYDFPPDASTKRIIQTMLDTFAAKVWQPMQPDFVAAKEKGHDLGDIVTIASLIEREARIKKDQPLIAAVIYNRLRLGMPLQIDATVQYVIGHRERVLYKDLAVDSPYNTYKVTGLPPGPICSPGIDAIRAALHPAKANYLFYTARPDGSHTFTTTLAQHVEATAQARAAMRRKEPTGG